MIYCGGGIKPFSICDAARLSATMERVAVSIADAIETEVGAPPPCSYHAVNYKIAAGSRGHGIAALFGAFVGGRETVEISEPWSESCQDVVAELVRFLAARGVKRFDLITRNQEETGCEEVWRLMADMAAGLGLLMRVHYVAGLHDRMARFLGTHGTWCVISGRGLQIYQAAKDAWERSSLDARRVRGSWLQGIHASSRCSLLSELRLDASAATTAHDEWSQVHAAPRALRRRLRHIRRLEQVELDGGKLSSRERALLRRRPAVVAALSRAGRPACGVTPVHPPRAALQWDTFEADLSEFKRKTLRELSGIIDFHISGHEEGQPVRQIQTFWKQQLVEDNLAIALRQQKDEFTKELGLLRKEVVAVNERSKSTSRADKLECVARGLQTESSRRASTMHRLEVHWSRMSSNTEKLDVRTNDVQEAVSRCEDLVQGLTPELAAQRRSSGHNGGAPGERPRLSLPRGCPPRGSP